MPYWDYRRSIAARISAGERERASGQMSGKGERKEWERVEERERDEREKIERMRRKFVFM